MNDPYYVSTNANCGALRACQNVEYVPFQERLFGCDELHVINQNIYHNYQNI